MNSQTEKKNTTNNENKINSQIEKSNISDGRSFLDKYPNLKEKEKNLILKKINSGIEIIPERNNLKVKELIDEEFLGEYDPQIQNNTKNPKLNFYIRCNSMSESDMEYSSESISKDSSEINENK